jgi:hypothetical protein
MGRLLRFAIAAITVVLGATSAEAAGCVWGNVAYSPGSMICTSSGWMYCSPNGTWVPAGGSICSQEDNRDQLAVRNHEGAEPEKLTILVSPRERVD